MRADGLFIAIEVDDYAAAVEAVKAGGATDYIRKSPGLVDEIKLAINRAVEKLNLSKQNFALRRDAAARNSLENIIGSSFAMEKLKQTVRTVASTAITISGSCWTRCGGSTA